MYLGLQKSVICRYFLSNLFAVGKEALKLSTKHLTQEKICIYFLSILVCAHYTNRMSKIKQK